MTKKHARAIRNERDFKGAARSAKKILEKPERESAEEQRLLALIEEMERYDDGGGDEDFADAAEDPNDWPRRRWSDDASGI